MNKKGDIWVSAILYFGLGIIVIAILLAAGLTVINKLKDKNITEVLNGGPGTQRIVTLNLKKGEFRIDKESEEIIWNYRNSKVFLSEPNGIAVKDGKIDVITTKGTTKGTYDITLKLNYGDLANINPDGTGKITTISGLGDVVIRNGGIDTNPERIVLA